MAFWKKLKTYAGWVREAIEARGTTPLRLMFTTLAAFLLLVQIIEIGYYVANASGSRAEIIAEDDDAANAIDVAGRTRWYKSNSFHAYGPVYFRLSHTLASFLSPLSEPGGLSQAEAQTRSVHLSLLMVSFLALLGLGFVLARVVSTGWAATFLLTALFVRGFSQSVVWQEFLLRAHPDLLLCLFIAIAVILTFRHWRAPQDKMAFRMAAWSWGLCLTTKFSVVLFLPFVVGWLLLPLGKKSARAALAFSGHMVVAFLVIGFPQNFSFARILGFLRYQSTYSAPATKASVIEWFQLWGEQLMAPLFMALVVCGALAFAARKSKRARLDKSLWLKCAMLALGPFVLVLGQNILAVHNHYPMPMVTAQVTVLLVLAAHTWAGRISFEKRSLVSESLLIFAILLFLAYGSAPRSFANSLSQRLHCRVEAREVFRKLSAYQSQGLKIYVDPYVPTLENMPNVTKNWRTTAEFIANGNFDVLIIKESYYGQFFAPTMADYHNRYLTDPAATADFYKIFQNREEVTDPRLGTWKRVDKDRCSWEIWRKDGP